MICWARFHPGVSMDVSNFAALKKKLVKEPKKKKETGVQKSVDEFFRKDGAVQVPEGEGPSQAVGTGAGAGGSQAEPKRKHSGKGVMPPEKKKKKGGHEKKDAPLVVVEEHSSSSPSASALPPPGDPGNSLAWPREDVRFSITKGTAIMHGTLSPREFLKGATPPTDKAVLSRAKDDALSAKVLQASVTAALGLGELLQRMEQYQAQKRQADEALAESRRQLQEVQETLRLEKEAFNSILENNKVIPRAEGKANAERAAAEAAKVAAEEAEAAKKVVVAEAEKHTVAAFAAGGWKAEDRKEWVASVIGQGVDAWVKGPGAEWLARKGKDYYDGGEFFTQKLIYRRLARHLKIDLKEFDPVAHGLPPLQPDVRVPLPEGEERPDLEDSELMGEGDDEEAEDDVASKAKEDAAEEAQK
ncbi:unnamed protein product [Cuscuta epithymum]|uniref:Uncharacterized protein n=1 Tax=Cuscuta epithymum TaxID=186058 RepID=A0AAV0FFC6_9ASTE|nr:unnamed protein product [Cuscuta epithymum]